MDRRVRFRGSRRPEQSPQSRTLNRLFYPWRQAWPPLRRGNGVSPSRERITRVSAATQAPRAKEHSPGIHPWVTRARNPRVPAGTKEPWAHAILLSPLRGWETSRPSIPTVDIASMPRFGKQWAKIGRPAGTFPEVKAPVVRYALLRPAASDPPFSVLCPPPSGLWPTASGLPCLDGRIMIRPYGLGSNGSVCATTEKVKHPRREKIFIPCCTTSYAVLERSARTEFRHGSCNTAPLGGRI